MSTHHPSQLLKPQGSGAQGWLMNRQEALVVRFHHSRASTHDDWGWVETGRLIAPGQATPEHRRQLSCLDAIKAFDMMRSSGWERTIAHW